MTVMKNPEGYDFSDQYPYLRYFIDMYYRELSYEMFEERGRDRVDTCILENAKSRYVVEGIRADIARYLDRPSTDHARFLTLFSPATDIINTTHAEGVHRWLEQLAAAFNQRSRG